jgi:hypothetical protein
VKKTITLNTEPHEAVVGTHTLLFQPEMYGDEFLDAYGRLMDVQKQLGDVSELSPDRIRGLYAEMRGFLARLMLPETAEVFSRHEVTATDGTVISVHIDRDAAEAAALEHADGATVEDKSLRLPDRVLVELMEWAVELYGGGGSRPTGSSNGSASASSKGGTPGRAPSSSRASIRGSGR